jgi:hypothetical protein
MFMRIVNVKRLLKESLNQDKLYYRGTIENRPLNGSEMVVSTDIAHAVQNSDQKKINVYRLNCAETSILSIGDETHQRILSTFVDRHRMDVVLRDLPGEIQWANIHYLYNSEKQLDAEAALAYAGFVGVKVRVHNDFESILMFNDRHLTLVKTLDISTPEARAKLGRNNLISTVLDTLK